MSPFTFAVRSKAASERIIVAARKVAPNGVGALEGVSDKDPETEQVKRLEAVADFLEAIAAPAITVPPASVNAPSANILSDSPTQSSTTTRKRAK